MRFLLDTNLLLWSLFAPAKLSAAALATIEDGANDITFSIVSIWEVAVKCGLGRPDFVYRPERVAAAALETGFSQLALDIASVSRVADLPVLHRDPFDRLLVAQAITRPAYLLTADTLLTRYSELVTLVR